MTGQIKSLKINMDKIVKLTYMMDKKKSITKIIREKQIVIKSITIKPNSGVDPVKRSGLGLHGLTRVNPEN